MLNDPAIWDMLAAGYAYPFTAAGYAYPFTDPLAEEEEREEVGQEPVRTEKKAPKRGASGGPASAD